MVRLKQYLVFNTNKGEYESQFHYGSIKTTFTGISREGLKLSQFHYGSIKTTNGLTTKKLSQASQFHYGSIKTKPATEKF